MNHDCHYALSMPIATKLHRAPVVPMLTVFVAQLSHPLVFGYTRLIGPETSVQPLTGRTSFRAARRPKAAFIHQCRSLARPISCAERTTVLPRTRE